MSSIVENKFIQVNEWGDPAKPGLLTLESEKIDLDKIQSDEIVVKMKVACVHPSDVMLAQGIYGFAKNVAENKLPSKIGNEGVGVIVKVGSEVKDYKVGQRIIPRINEQPQSYQTYFVCKRGYLVTQDFPDELACQLLINPYTALGLLQDLGLGEGAKAQKGWLVQNAANSTVGRLVHAIARERGLKTVALVRKDDAVPLMKSLGATKTIVVGNIKTADDYAKAIFDATDGEGAKYAIECVGGDVAGLGVYKAMAKDSQLNVYGALVGAPFSNQGLPNPNNVKLGGGGFWLVFDWLNAEDPKLVEKLNAELWDLHKKGKLDLPIEKTFAYEDFR